MTDYTDLARRLHRYAKRLAASWFEEDQEQAPDVRAAADALDAMGQQEPVATVHIARTGGNAGIAWHAIPTEHAPMMRDGDALYLHPPAAQPAYVPDQMREYARAVEQAAYAAAIKACENTQDYGLIAQVMKRDCADAIRRLTEQPK